MPAKKIFLTEEEKKSSSNKAKRKYDITHTIHMGLKFNVKTDFDILAKLAEQDNFQGYIKQLIRADIEVNPPMLKYEPRK